MSIFRAKYRYLYIIALSAYSYLNIKFTESDILVSLYSTEINLAAGLFFFIVLIWECNRLISYKFDNNKSLKFRHKPLIIHFLLSLVFVGLISFIGYSLIRSVLNSTIETQNLLRLILGFVFRINLFLHCINAIVYYWQQGSRFQLEAERFKKQSVEARYDALQKQVNPHFLFNSFNVLASLIPTDPNTASGFVEQLAVVYRYLLKNQHDKLVRLEEELRFLDAYIYLMKIRFRDNLLIVNDIPAELADHLVVPSSLQLLLENAIKHNEVSRKSPLLIRVYVDRGKIIVENDIQLKQQKVASSKVGLQNIKERYAFMNEDNPVVVTSDRKFTVEIPLIDHSIINDR